MAILTNFVQWLINSIGFALQSLLKLFPPSPFQFILDSDFADLVSKINWFIPIYEFVVIGEAWLVAVGIYYLYSVFARWIKAID